MHLQHKGPYLGASHTQAVPGYWVGGCHLTQAKTLPWKNWRNNIAVEDVLKNSGIRHFELSFSEEIPAPQDLKTKCCMEIWDETEQMEEGNDTKGSTEQCLFAEEQVSGRCSVTLLSLETAQMFRALLFWV